MAEIGSFTLTEQALLGLFYIQRYRFLTISQFARAADYKRPNASAQLRILERHGLLGFFGNTGSPLSPRPHKSALPSPQTDVEALSSTSMKPTTILMTVLKIF